MPARQSLLVATGRLHDPDKGYALQLGLLGCVLAQNNCGLHTSLGVRSSSPLRRGTRQFCLWGGWLLAAWLLAGWLGGGVGQKVAASTQALQPAWLIFPWRQRASKDGDRESRSAPPRATTSAYRLEIDFTLLTNTHSADHWQHTATHTMLPSARSHQRLGVAALVLASLLFLYTYRANLDPYVPDALRPTGEGDYRVQSSWKPGAVNASAPKPHAWREGWFKTKLPAAQLALLDKLAYHPQESWKDWRDETADYKWVVNARLTQLAACLASGRCHKNADKVSWACGVR